MTAASWIAAEDSLRLGAFVAVLAAMLVWELATPLRRAEVPRVVRWTNNLALVAVDGLVVRLLFPVLAVGAAAWAETRGLGLLPRLGLPGWAAFLAAFLAFDLAIWAQHRLFHAVPILWRLHRMHHADLDFDASTGLRFHPVEIVLSMAIKIALAVALGAPPLAVLAFEIALNATALFTHANISLPPRAEALVRLVFVTPDLHRVHHSIHPDETNSNFGFNLSVWDRMFGTLRPEPRDGQRGMTIGLETFRDQRWLRLDRLLVLPFVDPPEAQSGGQATIVTTTDPRL